MEHCSLCLSLSLSLSLSTSLFFQQRGPQSCLSLTHTLPPPTHTSVYVIDMTHFYLCHNSLHTQQQPESCHRHDSLISKHVTSPHTHLVTSHKNNDKWHVKTWDSLKSKHVTKQHIHLHIWTYMYTHTHMHTPQQLEVKGRLFKACQSDKYTRIYLSTNLQICLTETTWKF